MNLRRELLSHFEVVCTCLSCWCVITAQAVGCFQTDNVTCMLHSSVDDIHFIPLLLTVSLIHTTNS